MQDHWKLILLMSDDCVGIARKLIDSLESQRRALIEIDLEKLIEEESTKDMLLNSLKSRREELRKLILSHYQVSSTEALSQCLSGNEKTTWDAQATAWQTTWQLLFETTQRSQDFLQASLRTFGLLQDDIRTLMRESSTYSALGKKVDRDGTGKVIEARY